MNKLDVVMMRLTRDQFRSIADVEEEEEREGKASR